MPQAVQNPPQGYHTLTPYMTVRNARAAIDFYPRPSAPRRCCCSTCPTARSPTPRSASATRSSCWPRRTRPGATRARSSLGGSPMFLMAYVDDVDAAFRRAIDAGATEVRPVADQFYGDRSGTLKDPFGHQWTLATHIEDVSEAEAQRRMEAEFGKS